MKAKTLELILTSEDAEILHYAVMLRRLQKGLSPAAVEQAQWLAEYIEGMSIKAFGWDATIDRTKHYKNLIKHVTVKGYDLPPEEV